MELSFIPMTTYDHDFVEWLEEELNKRDWRPIDLASSSGLYPATVSKVLNRQRNPGNDFLRAIAKPLGYPEEIIFRKAGVLTEKPSGQITEERLNYLIQFDELRLEKLHHLFQQLDEIDRDEVIAFAELKIRLRAERNSVSSLKQQLAEVSLDDQAAALDIVISWLRSAGIEVTKRR
jgi:transcriptional regulator with XRE-family HTH domain